EGSIRMSETAVFHLGGGLGLVFVLLRSSARDGVIGARAQIDEYVLDVTHDIAIGAERGHDVFLRRVYVLAPVNHNAGEVGIVLRLQVTAECWGVTRSFAVVTPPAVARAPDHTENCSGTDHTILPVLPSQAMKLPMLDSPGGGYIDSVAPT